MHKRSNLDNVLDNAFMDLHEKRKNERIHTAQQSEMDAINAQIKKVRNLAGYAYMMGRMN